MSPSSKCGSNSQRVRETKEISLFPYYLLQINLLLKLRETSSEGFGNTRLYTYTLLTWTNTDFHKFTKIISGLFPNLIRILNVILILMWTVFDTPLHLLAKLANYVYCHEAEGFSTKLKFTTYFIRKYFFLYTVLLILFYQ